jgi:hypothetical protein
LSGKGWSPKRKTPRTIGTHTELDRALVLARDGDLISITEDPVVEARDTEFRKQPVTDIQ